MISDQFINRHFHRSALLARLGWLGLIVCLLVIFGLNERELFTDFATPCVRPCADPVYLSAAEVADLQARGYAPSAFAVAQVALYVVVFLVHAAIATLIFWHRPDERIARLAALALLVAGVTFPNISPHLWESIPALALLLTAGTMLGPLCFILFLFIFPNGRFTPRWLCAIFPVFAIYGALDTLLTIPALTGTPLAVTLQSVHLVFIFCVYGTIIGSHIYRYRYVSSSVERQQTKWVVFGVIVGLTWGFLIGLFVFWLDPSIASGALPKLLATGLIYLGYLLIPLSIGIAIMRSRLWDIDLIISRTLIYGTLTTLVVAIYIGIVGELGALFRDQNDLPSALIATGVVAVIFQPLRERVQRGINHLLYGKRDEPYAVVAQLGRRLEATFAPEAVLPTIADTVAQALRLPYVAIAIDQGGICINAAAAGHPVPNPLTLPLIYQGEPVGQIILGPRGQGDPFGATDRRLLNDLARQAGVAAHAVRLTTELQRITADLQHSREQLVSLREEERRRLRRDLHDGLGPTLASFTLTVGAVRNLLQRDPDAADALLAGLGTEIETAVADIKRLVYNLRPPALDELGLLGAIRARAAHFSTAKNSGGLQVSVEAPDVLPQVSAAVEVAAYRIVQEALTNVVRHARARRCVVRLTCGDALRIQVSDDGVGLQLSGTPKHSGVGMLSMQERAAELGGRCVVEPGPNGGTHVRAWLPLGAEYCVAAEQPVAILAEIQ